MAKARVASGLLAGCLLLWGGASPALAAPTPAQMLTFKPRQEGVAISTPTKEEEAGCTVSLVQGRRPGSSGWLLSDAQKRPLRRFFDSDGDKKIDVWSYYKDGVEVFREIDTNSNDRPDQFRWLNSAGMKWGIDANEDGKIDAWKTISAVEAAQEAYLAVAARDFNRLRALLIPEAELVALKLSATETEQIRKQLAGAQAKFQETVGKLTNLTEKAQFVRVETATPQLQPASASGPAQDVVRSPSRVVLYQGADGKHEWLHTGAMVQLQGGLAWRLLDVPGPGDETPPSPPDGKVDPILAELQKKVSDLDKNPPTVANPGANAEVASYYKQRVALIDQIVPRVTKADEREFWTKQLADNLSTWAQSSAEGDTAALQRVTQLAALTVKGTAPGSGLAAFVTYRRLLAEYMKEISKAGDDLRKWQVKWTDELSKFVQSYPNAEDTPDALMHLAMGCDFGGSKEKEDEAKRWYQQLVNNFGEHPLAAKARGCIRRLELVGRPLELAAATLSGPAYDVAKQRGKVVVVYYWASICQDCIGDFARLKQLQTSYASKGVEVVGVNVDEKAELANGFLQRNPLPIPHLFQATEQATGLAGPLATQYGIMSLPTLILVGKDGNVISRSLQINELEDALKKAL